jgi:glycerol kinase
VTNAARTNLMELSTLSWHGPTLQLFGAPAAMLPRIASNAEVYGHVAAGPLAGVPISGEARAAAGLLKQLQCNFTNDCERLWLPACLLELLHC